ncbi:MAG: hypothetical protein J0L70_05465 [Leptolyngbya sp. UWPOB_LEPTO1]|uniref:hypothetical protein n=1 Tax=Leptolyngbya sp. UWPOB_LEPTO1 TaxID=2815653 RepID=UPI001AD408CE|nr:hypothetical protein [Leptolyngbya sp. UWPOB_LEPTO1]MBN8559950.1 hypothetical protein [Leptolyngbya sp. UWPOB_LEPTO1]
MSTAPRFSLVLRGMRGANARTKYLNYLQGLAEQGEGIGTKGNRPDSIKLYLDPFALPLGTSIVVQSSALVPSWNLFSSLSEVSTRVTATLGSDTPIKLNTYRPARIVRRQQSSTTGVAATSKLTGLKYLKYNTESASIPFGKAGSTDTMVDAFNEIATQAKGSSTNLKFTLVEEKV